MDGLGHSILKRGRFSLALLLPLSTFDLKTERRSAALYDMNLNLKKVAFHRIPRAFP